MHAYNMYAWLADNTEEDKGMICMLTRYIIPKIFIVQELLM